MLELLFQRAPSQGRIHESQGRNISSGTNSWWVEAGMRGRSAMCPTCIPLVAVFLFLQMKHTFISNGRFFLLLFIRAPSEDQHSKRRRPPLLLPTLHVRSGHGEHPARLQWLPRHHPENASSPVRALVIGRALEADFWKEMDFWKSCASAEFESDGSSKSCGLMGPLYRHVRAHTHTQTRTHFYHAVEDQISCSIHLKQQPHFMANNCTHTHTRAHTLTET